MSLNQGWECPKCGACYNPTTAQCFNCTGNSVTVASSGPAPTPNYIPMPQSSTCPNCGQHASAIPWTGCNPLHHTGYAVSKGYVSSGSGATSGTCGPSVTVGYAPSAPPPTEPPISWVAKQLKNKLDEETPF